MLNSYLDSIFKAIKKSDNNKHDEGNDIKLINLGPIALFSIFKLTTSSGRHIEDISQTHIVYLLSNLITSSRAVMICLDSIQIAEGNETI